MKNSEETCVIQGRMANYQEHCPENYDKAIKSEIFKIFILGLWKLTSN